MKKIFQVEVKEIISNYFIKNIIEEESEINRTLVLDKGHIFKNNLFFNVT